ncbi:hypothetical protein Glove_30g100 [Diversispora epigaea]|uniref:Uncharacterized protein n=1 Tax=Diversispora epigaea TaxID=1348612 RepID=A0A397JHE9_9GLOM|nr:hypothetical protein Glove_30g100 [Diversispora epigaea]
MAKIATSFVNRYKLTSQTSLPQLSGYTEELARNLSDVRDQAKRRFQQLGLSKEQADVLIPIRVPGRRIEERDPIKAIAQNIIKNNLSPEEINGIAYDLASSAPTTVAGNSRLNLLRKELRELGADYLITAVTKIPFVTEEANQIQARKRILRGINGYNCPSFFYLEKVQERLSECDFTGPPSMQNLIDVMIMLCMRSADVENLRINRYKPSHDSWYNPDYSWYCTGYAKNKDRGGNTNVTMLNQFLSRHKITSSILRKIGADHASRVHGGKNNSRRQTLRQLACRHKIGHALSVEHYGVINDRPVIPISKQEIDKDENIYDLFGKCSDDEN